LWFDPSNLAAVMGWGNGSWMPSIPWL
jgi:hypothetical protein